MTALQKIEDPADVLLRALDEMLAESGDTNPYIRSNTNFYEQARLIRRHKKLPVRRLISVQRWTAHRMLRCASCERPIAAKSEYLHFKSHIHRSGSKGFDHCMRCSMMARAVWGEDADLAIVHHLIMKADAPGPIRSAWNTVIGLLGLIVYAIVEQWNNFWRSAASPQEDQGQRKLMTTTTAALLAFAVVGTVVLASRPRSAAPPEPPP